ncbi:MAG TPA: carboxypeptidase-like regulatory domain-containing protein [Thermoanaerobaculia bacterium]|nr:carboxypeptidase-like regulatory domain-containing protein [Thermoanaerobaculia bacterium]
MLPRPARLLLGSALLAALCTPVSAAEIPIEGAVLGLDGLGIQGSQVELRPVLTRYEAGMAELAGRGEPQPVARAATGSMGRFRLNAPRPGLWRLVAVAAGYLTLEIPALPVLEETRVPAARMRPASDLLVRLADEAGQPLPAKAAAGVRVLGQTGRPELWGASGWQPSRRLGTSGPDGTLRLPRALAEPLRLWAAGPGIPAQGGSLADGHEAVLPLERGQERPLATREAARDQPAPAALFSDPRSSLLLGFFDGQHPLGLPAPSAGPWNLRLDLADGRKAFSRVDTPHGAAGTGPLRLLVLPALPVAGRIAGAGGGQHALAGALVWPADDPGSVTLSDAAGAYRLAGRAAGSRFDLRGAAAGYQSGHVKTALPFESQQNPFPAPDLLLLPSPVPAITGLVVDEGGKPVAGAEVRIVRSNGEVLWGSPESRLATTAADGSFRFAPLEPGAPFALTASRQGFAPATLFASVPQPPRASSPVRVALTHGRTASGRVLDPRQRPISGAAVQLTHVPLQTASEDEPELGPFRAETDPDGGFQIPDLPPGLFGLRIEGAELVPLPEKEVVISQGEGPLDLGTFTLEGRAPVAGWIVDPAGQPIEGVEVWIVPDSPGSMAQEDREAGPAAVTGRDGRFELRDRSVGNHEKLRACARGYLPAEAEVPGPAAAEPRIELTPTLRLSGKVVSVEGEPLPGASVFANLTGSSARDRVLLGLAPSCPQVGSAVTGAEGAFTLELQEPGEYLLSAWGAGHVASNRNRLEVPAEGLDGVEIRMSGGAVVTGHLADLEGHPVGGAAISISNSEANAQTVSDSGGDYLLEGVAPGEQDLLVTHADYETVGRHVQIPAAGTRFDLALTPLPHLVIRGRVSGPDGAPIQGALVGASGSYRTSTEADGSFVLPVVRGSYNLLAEKDGLAPAETGTLTITDRSLDGLEIRLGHGRTLTGRIRGLDPAAVSGISVIVMTAAANVVEAQALIDSGGSFEVANLPPGEWLLSARTGERRVADRFTPPAGSSGVERDIEFPPVFEVRGQITGPGGEPVEGASLRFAAGPEQSFATATQADGSFSVDLTDGTYTIYVVMARYTDRKGAQTVVVAGASVDGVQIQMLGDSAAP